MTTITTPTPSGSQHLRTAVLAATAALVAALQTYPSTTAYRWS